VTPSSLAFPLAPRAAMPLRRIGSNSSSGSFRGEASFLAASLTRVLAGAGGFPGYAGGGAGVHWEWGGGGGACWGGAVPWEPGACCGAGPSGGPVAPKGWGAGDLHGPNRECTLPLSFMGLEPVDSDTTSDRISESAAQNPRVGFTVHLVAYASGTLSGTNGWWGCRRAVCAGHVGEHAGLTGRESWSRPRHRWVCG